MRESVTTCPELSDPASWKPLAEVAIRGLRETYSGEQPALPYTRVWNGREAICSGRSIRYALISLLGLDKAAALFGARDDLADRLWNRVLQLAGTLDLPAGDLGLGLWVASVYGSQEDRFSAEAALRVYRARPGIVDSVERAWLLLGAEHALLTAAGSSAVEQLADVAKRDLLALYNSQTSLFFRHARQSPLHAVSRRVACYANQVYPLMALAVHARRTGCPQAREAVAALADKLCRFQGQQGQWWWLYDARDGVIVDGYPVFSVHQHGMAPMGLFMAGGALDRSFGGEIQRGLGWIFGSNELSENLVLSEQGMILREIHRRGFGRARRMLRGTLWCCGWRRAGGGAPLHARFEVNPECRPYELGWLLYAAGLATQACAADARPGRKALTS